jgi:hypothetical protein
MKERMKINELLETTTHKRLKEYMTTNKPSRRKLYIEIYEFNDKTKITKLPTTKEKKVDEPKKAKIEYDCVSKDIIHIKLDRLQVNSISFIRLKEFCKKFSLTIDVVELMLHNGRFDTYGTVVPPKFNEAVERYFLMIGRNGKIYGWIGMSWNTQLELNNEVKVFGGDVVSIGISTEIDSKVINDVHKTIRSIYENVLFKEMVTMRFPQSYGDLNLAGQNVWFRYNFGLGLGCSWIPVDAYNKLLPNGQNYFNNFYSHPETKIFVNAEEIQAWIKIFEENYRLSWKQRYNAEMTMEETQNMIAAREVEKNRIIEVNRRSMNEWLTNMTRKLRGHGEDLLRMSHCGTLLRANRTSRHDTEDNDGEISQDEPDSCAEGCDEFGDNHYCREECGGNPCDNCHGDCAGCPIA